MRRRKRGMTYIHKRSVEFFYLRHILSAALSLEQCSLRTSDSQGAKVVHAGLNERGIKV